MTTDFDNTSLEKIPHWAGLLQGETFASIEV
jgi:hypothetical protein